MVADERESNSTTTLAIMLLVVVMFVVVAGGFVLFTFRSLVASKRAQLEAEKARMLAEEAAATAKWNEEVARLEASRSKNEPPREVVLTENTAEATNKTEEVPFEAAPEESSTSLPKESDTLVDQGS